MSQLERESFEKAIEYNPRDWYSRSVFADWLEEFGNQSSDDDLAKHHREWNDEKQDAKEWLVELSKRIRTNDDYGDYDTGIHEDQVSYDDLIRIGHEYLDKRKIINVSMNVSNDLYDITFTEFWEKFCLVTGRVTDFEDEYDNKFYRCNC